MKQIQKNTTQHTVMMGMFFDEHFNILTKTGIIKLSYLLNALQNLKGNLQ